MTLPAVVGSSSPSLLTQDYGEWELSSGCHTFALCTYFPNSISKWRAISSDQAVSLLLFPFQEAVRSFCSWLHLKFVLFILAIESIRLTIKEWIILYMWIRAELCYVQEFRWRRWLPVENWAGQPLTVHSSSYLNQLLESKNPFK